MLYVFRDPRLFARGWAVILVVLVVLGIVLEFTTGGTLLPGLLNFDWTHDILHVGLLALALYMGWRAPFGQVVFYARIYGVAGLALAVAGFIPAAHDGLAVLGLYLEPLENIVHGAIAVWGLASGFWTAPVRLAFGSNRS